MKGSEKTFYLIRHCQAEGQHPQAELTVEGRAQADRLARFLLKWKFLISFRALMCGQSNQLNQL
ncbi:histidine phosphatase family protein [Planococcus koreensis]|uniref:histidine phosphatase family protein n=1 Tax=Planococcus koreensis TaxID=112331 RepID=UPI001F4FBA94|nr:histidine phosphatase family protein [Planococcus koreensis]